MELIKQAINCTNLTTITIPSFYSYSDSQFNEFCRCGLYVKKIAWIDSSKKKELSDYNNGVLANVITKKYPCPHDQPSRVNLLEFSISKLCLVTLRIYTSRQSWNKTLSGKV